MSAAMDVMSCDLWCSYLFGSKGFTVFTEDKFGSMIEESRIAGGKLILIKDA